MGTREECVKKVIEYHIRKGKRKILRSLLKVFEGFLSREKIIQLYNEVNKQFPTLDKFFGNCVRDAND